MSDQLAGPAQAHGAARRALESARPAALLIVALTSLAHGQGNPSDSVPARPATCVTAGCEGVFNIYFDQDWLQTTPSTDRNYTMGLGLSRASHRIREQHRDIPLRFFDALARRALISPILGTTDLAALRRLEPGNLPDTLYAEMVSGTAYTPEKLFRTDPSPGDRPYGFLLGWTVSSTVYSRDEHHAVTTELTLGTIGSRLGRNVQRFIHQTLRGSRPDCDSLRVKETGPCDPKGWGNQIMDVPSVLLGIPTFRYAMSREDGGALGSWRDGSRMIEAAAGVGGEVGYYTTAWTGARVRLGYFQTPFYAWKENPLDVGTRAPGNGPAPPWTEVFVFGGLRPRLVLYNALLQGYPGYRGNAFSFADVEHAVVDGELGVSWLIRFGEANRRSVRLTWMANGFRSSEYDSPLSRAHQWGGVYLSFPTAWLPSIPH